MDVLAAKIDLLEADIKAQELDETDTFVYLANRGVPASVLLTLEPIWRTTKKLGGRVIALGKIILFKIIEFIQAHSHTAIGMAIGAAIGALTSLIPFIGPLLAPVATALGIAVFGTMGACMDCNTPSSGQALIHTAMDFFKLFAEIINTLFNELAEE